MKDIAYEQIAVLLQDMSADELDTLLAFIQNLLDKRM